MSTGSSILLSILPSQVFHNLNFQLSLAVAILPLNLFVFRLTSFLQSLTMSTPWAKYKPMRGQDDLEISGDRSEPWPYSGHKGSLK